MKKDFIVRRSIAIVEGKPHVETYSEQELIRCKDCKWGLLGKKDVVCMKTTLRGLHEPDWFCADGEKKDD